MVNSTKKWYAIYTRAGCEKKVSNVLSRKDIANFCPIKRRANGIKSSHPEPLFPTYVFVQISEAEMNIVRNVGNVMNFVYWLGNPVIIHNEEVEIMKRFMSEYVNVRLEKIDLFTEALPDLVQPGAEVLVEKLNLVTIKNNLVKIVLPSLGFAMVAEVEKSSVEVFTPNQIYNVNEKFQYAI